jgi:hypothetical protein
VREVVDEEVVEGQEKSRGRSFGEFEVKRES